MVLIYLDANHRYTKLVHCGALKACRERCRVCGSLLVSISRCTQDMSTHQIDEREDSSTVYSPPPVNISNKVVEGGLGRVYAVIPQPNVGRGKFPLF